MSQKIPQHHLRIRSMRPLAALLAAALSVPAFAQSVQFPTYTPGPQTNGTFVVSDGTILTPAGTQVNLGIRVRAKAIALNPNPITHTAAVLTMGTSASNGNGAVEVFNTQTGVVVQSYNFSSAPYSAAHPDSTGSSLGITYSADGAYLLFSQDSSHVTIANVNPTTGVLTDFAHVSVPLDATSVSVPGIGSFPLLANANCTQTVTMPATGVAISGPVGTTGSVAVPCGIPVSAASDGSMTSYPTGVAVSRDFKTAYAALNFNDTLAKIDLTQTPPIEVSDIRVGNVPHSVLISPDGTTAYVSNEAGRIATTGDFQLYSNGTPVVAANPTGATSTGTISVVDLATFTVKGSITTGLHPTGMAFWGATTLLVANAYDDTLSVINTSTNTVTHTISLGLPVRVPGAATAAYGAGPNSIAVDSTSNTAYVALYNANAIAVVSLPSGALRGLIPVGYAPSSVVLDSIDNELLVANDKGWGTTGNPNPFEGTVAGAPLTANSTATEFGSPAALNTHQDLGTVSIIPVPNAGELATWTNQVHLNNHWDLLPNMRRAAGGSSAKAPVAIPAFIGDPSLIKHVFLIIRENRTYDQILGDVVGGNGDPSLATFGDDTSVTGQGGPVTPNAHALVTRFPLLDNFYDPSRQSADGHNWIVQAMAPYSDDIQSPDWLRDYPSNGGDALAYQNKGNLYDLAVRSGVTVKNFGEYVEENTFNVPGCTPTEYTMSCEPTWSQFYQDTVDYENGVESQLTYFNDVGSYSPLPDVMNNTVQNYPQFDLGIPDQYRVDVWKQNFAADTANNTCNAPQLETMWISSDHTGGQPTAQAMQADNDLAIGRFVDIISHSPCWSTSAIFIEEDDAQTGVDHVDGHRSPGYVISPYVYQKVTKEGTGAGVREESTFYTQVNITRTIEQILGMTPMNQNDLMASPMFNIFTSAPAPNYFLPWTHIPNGIPLDLGVTPIEAKNESREVKALRVGWMKKKAEVFAGRYQKPDSEDPDTVSHMIWYESTGYTRPFPGEKKVRPASDFNRPAPKVTADLDD